MLFTHWMWAIGTIILCSILALLNTKKKKQNKILPPSPRGLPVIGHLHLLGKNAHHDMCNLSKKHGPIMHLQFGFVTNIIVSSPHGAEQFLKTHDLVCASRPPLEAAKYLLYEQRDLSFSKYGAYWRNMRKMCTIQLLSNLKVNSFQSMRRHEIGLLVKTLKEASENRRGVNLSAEISSVSADMSCIMVFGKKYLDQEFHEKGFKGVIQEGMYLSAAPNLGDYFPLLGFLDPQGINRRLKKISKIYDKFFEMIIDEHEKLMSDDGDENRRNDFVSTMLAFMKSGENDFEFDRRHIKATMLDMLAASMDTTGTAIEWLLSELLKQPQVMKKVQRELEETVGLERMVNEGDLDKLKYLDMVIKETFRLHPPVPLLVPHQAMDDCQVDGYHIPKDSRIIINAWAIGRDPEVWSDPEKFNPERFVGSKVDVKGLNFELIPFGSGRRGCPGMQLGLTMVRLVAAQLVHCFDWELPDNMLPEELDMEEEFGVVVSRATRLVAIPTYRLIDSSLNDGKF